MTVENTWTVPDDDDVEGYFESLSNWGRWGPSDELGTLNHLTSDRIKEAAGLIRRGRRVSCALPLSRMEMAPGLTMPIQHFMLESGDGWDSGRKISAPAQGMQIALDWIGMVFHGHGITHVDTPAHVFYKNQLYNGYPSEVVSTRYGATKCGVDRSHQGIVGRGVLLDIPALDGREHLNKGEAIMPAQLDAAEEAAGLQVGAGDILFIRTGIEKLRESGYEVAVAETPGLHASVLPWLRERDIAVLGSDSLSDVGPSGYRLRMPIHQVGLVGLGLWLIDNVSLEPLRDVCAEEQRWEFFLSTGALRLANATGSPLNPIAVF